MGTTTFPCTTATSLEALSLFIPESSHQQTFVVDKVSNSHLYTPKPTSQPTDKHLSQDAVLHLHPRGSHVRLRRRPERYRVRPILLLRSAPGVWWLHLQLLQPIPDLDSRPANWRCCNRCRHWWHGRSHWQRY